MRIFHDIGRFFDASLSNVRQRIFERAQYRAEWTIRRWNSGEDWRAGTQPSSVSKILHNVLLNEGINELFTLICSASGTKWDNTNARLGVGNGTAAEAAAQTGLQGATTTFKGMDAGFPTYGTSQKATWRSTFQAAEANHAWEEFTVDNGSVANKNLNRKVSAQGTKVSGQVWELTLEISLS